ncbi:hypothetical protein RHGRI_000080 [Rhododendron griersonianum]|uniref:xylose isomerase n=1 Tax=Rhododendron griersonianum TaxID=479676 RepID=A0AAV6LF51_9ERIC|nr:hypothetical protein RHGRI_000080 [Rhododendron griersonianum]
MSSLLDVLNGTSLILITTLTANSCFPQLFHAFDLQSVRPRVFVQYGFGCLENIAEPGDSCTKETHEKLRVVGCSFPFCWISAIKGTLDRASKGPTCCLDMESNKASKVDQLDAQVTRAEEVVDPPYSLKLVEECSLDLVLSSLFCYPGAATNNCLVSAVNLSWLSILNSALHELHLMYDWDAATTANFLRKYGLAGEFKLNIERNHATLSGRRVLVFCLVALYLFVSRDFSLRRESTDVEHLFIAHISGMDTLVRGLRNVAMLIEMIHSSFLRSIRGTRGDDFPISSIDD